MNNRVSLFTAAGLGAIATYYLDPDRGRRRRADVRDKVNHLGHALPHHLNVAARDLGHRAEGTIAEVRSRLVPHRGYPSDDVIEDRVRSAMGRVVSHPHSIQVCADQGRVTLSGLIFTDEVEPLLGCVNQVKDVKSIDNQLEAHRREDNEPIPSLQGGTRRHTVHKLDVLQANWAPATRWIMGLVGSGLASGVWVRSWPMPARAASGTLGLLMVTRSLTNLETKRLLGLGRRRALTLHKTMELAAPIWEVYRFWSEFENFPSFMRGVLDVRTHGNKRRSHWTIRGPAGSHLHFDAERTREIPNRLLAWKTVRGSLIRHSGKVTFFEGMRGGTKIELELSFNPPAGMLGLELAKLLGLEPKKLVEESLCQMKQLIEQGPSARQTRARAV